MKPHPFKGRSFTVIGDFNRWERLYLYEQTRKLKHAMAAGDGREITEVFRINNPDMGLYEIFLENSTRTRESFKNAAHFHRMKVSELNAESSSFNKKESYADTIANLVGYGNHIFVLRTSLEGVCRHLAEETERYRLRHGMTDPVSVINAGDGRHEHPTQELLDEFTFLEDLRWSADSIHLALVGDLYHGRTVHSKVHGLDLFSSVTVDLIAPPELAMPGHYLRHMEDQGFQVRTFPSITSYLQSGSVAPQWYFTRPQIERMGDRILRRQDELREAITFTPDMIHLVDDRTRFYHPLPRHREHPTIPAALDGTHLNGWERQSANGYLVRIVLLALVAGKLGADYEGPVGPEIPEEPAFVQDVPVISRSRKHYSEGVRPIDDGIVIDHICVGDTPREIRAHIATLQAVADLNGRGGEWISTGKDGRYKGVLFRPDLKDLPEKSIATVAAVAPGSTINIVSKGTIIRKIRLSPPYRIADTPALRCTNPACITHPDHGENVRPTFVRTIENRYTCEYCGREHGFKEIWQ